MIVTKEMAEKYLIARRCYLITTGPDGDYQITHASVHWKEGMEVFEDRDECLRELEKRERAKINSGYCPRCNYKSLTDTEKDITHLDLIGDAKGGKIYECKECKSVWFKHPSYKSAMAYDAILKDFLIEWGVRDMKPTPAMKSVLNEAGNISTESNFDLYPVDVLLKGKEEFEPALIHLEKMPPSQRQFNRRDWSYLDSVEEIRISPFAYPAGIAKHIARAMRKSNEIIYIKSEQTKKSYCFLPHAGVFMPMELKGQDFTLTTDLNDRKNASMYYMPADRGGPDIWTMTQVIPLMIFGDKM